MSIISVSINGAGSSQPLEIPSECPICKSHVVPPVIYAATGNHLCSNGQRDDGVAVYYCPACHRAFMSSIFKGISETWSFEHLEPSRPVVSLFNEILKDISPSFIEIYHQAEAAEAYNLGEIAGMGYRKSLEFLIKDWLIQQNPKDKADIEKLLLGACINNYITQPNIKATATAATWLGNDETHYVRKWLDKDISDMKVFIDACLHFILADYQAAEALKMITPPAPTP